MGDVIAIALIVIIIGLATLYIIKAKKSGQKCIGCPNAKACAEKMKNASGCSGCCSSCQSSCSNKK